MLAIRMQRTGRKGHAMFRVVVQDARRTPTSGKLVAHLGSYDPHSKVTVLNKTQAQFYLDHGAQPSARAVILLTKEGVSLPKWVKVSAKKERAVRNPDKRRSTQPAQEATEAPEAAAEAVATEDPEKAEEPAATETSQPEAPEEAETSHDVPEKSAPEVTEEKPEA